MPFIFSLACFEAKRLKKKTELRRLKHLRARPDESFLKSFRVDKDTFKIILQKLQPHLKTTRLPQSIQFAAVLRFLATGSFQLCVAKDHHINIGRSTFGKVLHKYIPLMESVLCAENISLQMTEPQIQQSRENFYRKYQLPRIVACIDGTHIRLLKPVQNESVFFNRKGFFSLNAMLICNHNMEILAVDATHPGSYHDSFIWKNSQAKNYLSRSINDNFILADSGYALERFVLTPYRNAELGTFQHKFNMKHAAARNIVERTIGVLKSRFRCLQHGLNYEPKFACKIVNVCCALHNICRQRNTPSEEYVEHNESLENDNAENEYEDHHDGVSLRDEIGVSLRDEIARIIR
ncbi:putative nuclease HARBI1 isoform X1 [Rhagoletis pomonella]|uniref:putative nuclease HARBI1 isoform X1 n=1 Tax=Rhagoletis pomonella TaxID=28610 RepID=UPI0017867C09|nr:putative nuclease HARBI1 isoform X1 [Rhagoletis pomonella]